MSSAVPATDDRGAGPLRPAWERQGTVYVVGVDGITYDVIEPMLSSGELPAFARLAERGASGRLETIRPTNSSLLWTSIATGRHHEDHGIDGFQYYRVLGRHLSRTAIRKYRKYGLRVLVGLAKALGLRRKYHFDGRSIRVKTFWDVVSEAGGNVVVVNWWHSWPAEPVNGCIVSDRLHYWRSAFRGKEPVDSHLTYPAELVDELRELMVAPEDIAAADVRRFIDLPLDEVRRRLEAGYNHRDPFTEVRFLASMDRSQARVFHYCLDRTPAPDVAAVYFRGPDIAQHCAFDYMTSSVHSGATDQERRVYGGFVPEAYRMADRHVGEILDRLGPEDTIFVLSDHGYGRQEHGGRHGPYGHHTCKPPGMLYAVGPEFRAGAAVRDACIYDLMPTLMRVLGYPPAADFTGRCLEELFTSEFVAERPPLEPVPSYGARARRHDTAVMSDEVNDEVTEHLRALGYID